MFPATAMGSKYYSLVGLWFLKALLSFKLEELYVLLSLDELLLQMEVFNLLSFFRFVIAVKYSQSRFNLVI